MKHYLLNHQPQKGLQAACAQQGQAPTCNARGKGHTSASPKTLTRILLVLLTMLLLPNAAWGQDPAIGINYDSALGKLYFWSESASKVIYQWDNGTQNEYTIGSGAGFPVQAGTLTYWANGDEGNKFTIIYYGLIIGDTPLTNNNVDGKGAVSGIVQKISFTPADESTSTPATLTLDNANFGPSLNGIIWCGNGALKIQFSGNSIINTRSGASLNADNGYCILGKSSSDLILSASNNASTLTLSPHNGGSGNSRAAISGFTSVSLNEGWGMYYTDNYTVVNPNTSPTAGKEVILSKGQPLGLSVAGVVVTSENKGNILGDNTVSFEPAKEVVDQTGGSNIPATLTLNGATINGKIEWNSSDNLTIALNGKNTITSEKGEVLFIYESPCALNIVKADNAESATLKYASYSKSDGKIANASEYFSNFSSITPSSDFKTPFTVQVGGINYNYYTTEEVYSLAVAGRQVHNISGEPGNKDDILGDEKGKVIFNGTNKLTLNNAELSGPIASGLSALTIHLIGENTLIGGYIAGDGANVSPTLTLEKEDANSNLTISSAEQFIFGFTSFTSDFSLFGFNDAYSPLSGNFEYTGNALEWRGAGSPSVMKAFVLFDGAGTTDSPYLIQTKEDLAKLSTFCGQGLITHGSVYQLSTDIDCTGLDFEPIGVGEESGIKGFTGIFDGNSKTISNLTINTNSAAAGLFAKLGDDQQDGIIKNLKLSNCSFIGPDDVGAVVGYFHKGTVKNCEISSCTIQCGDAQSPRVGGIAGQVLNENSISGCKVSNTTITASTTYTSESGVVSVGGIAGYVYSGCEVTECEATSVTINAHHSNGSSNAGGIAGDFGGSILKDNTVNGTQTAITTISSTDIADIFKAGAIAGNISTGVTMEHNIYYYPVTITSGKGTSDENTKSGYIHRGTNSDTDPEGVLMYTKNVIIPIRNDVGNVSIGEAYYYNNSSDGTNTTYKVAPGEEVLVSVEGAAIEGSYTLDNETKAITLTPKEDSSYGYTFDMPDADVTFTIQKAAWVEMFEEQTYATYYNPNEDMAVPMGMTAYIVTGISEDGTKVTVSPVSYIKAGVAVLVEKGEIGEISETTDFSGSKMAYSDPDTPAKPSATDKWYVIYNNKFVKVTTGTEVSGGKCYLNLNGTSSSGTRGFYDIDGSDGTTAIKDVKSGEVDGEKWADGGWHDLQGRRLSAKPTKPGLYILNGKKVVIK